MRGANSNATLVLIDGDAGQRLRPVAASTSPISRPTTSGASKFYRGAQSALYGFRGDRWRDQHLHAKGFTRRSSSGSFAVEGGIRRLRSVACGRSRRPAREAAWTTVSAASHQRNDGFSKASEQIRQHREPTIGANSHGFGQPWERDFAQDDDASTSPFAFLRRGDRP